MLQFTYEGYDVDCKPQSQILHFQFLELRSPLNSSISIHWTEIIDNYQGILKHHSFIKYEKFEVACDFGI